MWFLKREDPKTIIEGLDRAQAILDERYNKKQITGEMYQKQSIEFMNKREKYQKKINKNK